MLFWGSVRERGKNKDEENNRKEMRTEKNVYSCGHLHGRGLGLAVSVVVVVVVIVAAKAPTTLAGEQTWQGDKYDGRGEYHKNAYTKANTDGLNAIEENCHTAMTKLVLARARVVMK